MNKIGIIFGTDTGTTRLIAKKMAKKLGDLADKPININRIGLEEMLKYDFLILGTPTYGHGQLPGKDTNIANGSWADFLPQLEQADLSGKVVALYGLGNQDKYSERFADSLFYLYDIIKQRGATIIGSWSTEGYNYEFSKAEVDGRFVGLVLDNNSQGMLTEQRIDDWLKLITPELTEELAASA
jgi:flavodoxin I